MRLLSILALTFIFSSIVLLTMGQSGSLYLTHFKGPKWKDDKNWSIVQDQRNNMIFANRKGIIVYSGNEKNYVKTPSMPYLLKKDTTTNTIYVACKRHFGYLQLTPKGVYQYQGIYKADGKEDFTKILISDSTIYFMGNESIYRINRQNKKINHNWETGANKPFTGLFKNPEHIFINVWNKGLYRLESDTLFPVVSGFWTKKDQIIFSIKYDNKNVLIGTQDNELYLFNGYKFYRYKPESYKYLKESSIMGGMNISDNRMAIGTMAGGAVIINKNTDKTDYIINYPTGLPEDEIYALGKDQNNGLWISHDQGMTRAALNLPVKNMRTYPGLKGRPLHAAQADTTLFVATTDAIYYLAKEEKYQKDVVTVKEEITAEEKETKEKKDRQKDKDKKPDNLFKRIADKLFNNNKGKKEDPESIQAKAEQRAPQYRYRKKEIYSLESINFVYKKIEDLTGKYNQLLPYKDGLLVATNNGVYYINKKKNIRQIVKNTNVHHITISKDSSNILAATQNGLKKVYSKNQSWIETNPAPSLTKTLYSAAILDSNTLWAGGEDTAYRIKLLENQNNKITTYHVETRYPERYKVSTYKDSVYLLLNEGIYKYMEHADSLKPHPFSRKNRETLKNYSYNISQPHHIWVNQKGTWSKFHQQSHRPSINAYLNLFSSIEDIYAKNGLAWITASDGIYRINLNQKAPENKNFKAFFSSIRKDGQSRLQIQNFNFNQENAALEFRISAPSYLRQNKTKYQYQIEGMMEGWSQWRSSPTIQLFTKKGSYKIKARARNIWGEIKETQTIQFEIPPPFTETVWFYIIIAAVAVLLVLAIIKIREKKLQRDKKILEQKVQQRTQTIEDQKEEIKIQRDDIEKKKNKLERKNEKITDSIEYASRIQGALLPMTNHFYNSFSDHFILFKPRDIVSGDFYWITQKGKKVFVTASDCTGHGVPGAFMSMLGISFLNEITNEKDKENNCSAACILDELRDMVKRSLHQSLDKERKKGVKDGMDMAFCIIDYDKNIIQFAGAQNPLFICRNNGEFEEIKGDRMPVGTYLKKEEKPFTNHTIKFNKGDAFYMFSDGYPDQFGGPNDKKFKKKNLKNLLSDIHDRNMEEQHRLLDHNFEEWKGDRLQTDDVILLGFRI